MRRGWLVYFLTVMLGAPCEPYSPYLRHLLGFAFRFWAQSPLTKILLDELTRNFTILKQQGDPPPYFMGYEVTETESNAGRIQRRID